MISDTLKASFRNQEEEEKPEIEFTKAIENEANALIETYKLKPVETMEYIKRGFREGKQDAIKPYIAADLILPISMFRKGKLRLERLHAAETNLTAFFIKYGIALNYGVRTPEIKELEDSITQRREANSTLIEKSTMNWYGEEKAKALNRCIYKRAMRKAATLDELARIKAENLAFTTFKSLAGEIEEIAGNSKDYSQFLDKHKF